MKFIKLLFVLLLLVFTSQTGKAQTGMDIGKIEIFALNATLRTIEVEIIGSEMAKYDKVVCKLKGQKQSEIWTYYPLKLKVNNAGSLNPIFTGTFTPSNPDEKVFDVEIDAYIKGSLVPKSMKKKIRQTEK